MKALSAGKRGFSTLELVIALALISLVMAAVELSSWGSSYWAIASQTSNEALYKAKTRLEDLRADAAQNFFSIASSPMQKDTDPSCTSGGLCYFVGDTVVDLSQCAKYAQAQVFWQVDGYPTTTTSLFTTLTSPKEILAQGADCLLAAPAGDWGGTPQSSSYTLSSAPTAIDALSGIAYVALAQIPYLSIVTQGGVSTFSNGFALDYPANAIDVARSATTGRTYAYLAIASTSQQFQVVDVTDATAPFLVATAALSGVSGTAPQGFRIAYYNNRIYLTTLRTDGPELHIFDVSTPESPLYLGSKELNTSVYGIAARTEGQGTSAHTLVYLATENDTKEVMVFDVTNPLSIATPATLDLPDTGCSLSDKPNATSLSLAGEDLWVGRQRTSCTSLSGLYRVDVSDSSHPALESGPMVPASIVGVRVSGELVFVETGVASATASNLLDLDGDYAYTVPASSSGGRLEVWSADPSNFQKLSSTNLSALSLRVFQSQ